MAHVVRFWRSRAFALLGLTLVFALCIGFSAQVASAALINLDDGFETGSDGASLVPPWTLNAAPQRYEYDSTQAKSGALSAWIQGPVGAAGYAGIANDAITGMDLQGAELYLWVYFDTANENRVVTDGGATELRWDTLGRMLLFHQNATAAGYATSAYTPVGTYSTGWTQYRIVYDFAGGTVALSSRAAVGDPWTRHKSAAAPDYNIPMRNTATPTQTGSLLFRTWGNMWLDDIQYTDFTEPVITVNGVTEGQSSPDPVTITFSASDNLDPAPATTATLNGNAVTSGTGVSVPGSYVLVVTSTDSTGNTATKTVNFTIEEPPAPPVVSTPASSAWSLALLVGFGAGVIPLLRRRRA